MRTAKTKQGEELEYTVSPNYLPEGWVTTTLRDLTESVPNTEPESEPYRDFGYIDISSIDNRNYKIIGHKQFKGKDAPSRARRPIRPGDVLFSNVRTYLRNIAIVPPDCPALLCSTGFTVIRSNGAADPKFLFYYTLTDGLVGALTEQQTGSNYPATSDRIVLSSTLQIAPLPEQKRIVAKVEELLAEVNKVRSGLEKVPKILKAFRQSVLAAACSGRLTEDWRSKNGGGGGAAKLLNAILKNRNWNRRTGTVSSIRYNEPVSPDPRSLPDSPKDWEPASMDQLTCLVTSGSRGWAKYYSADGPYFIRAENINTDSLRLDEIAHVHPPGNTEGRRTRVASGDLLITITGANVTKSALVDLELDEAYVSQHVALASTPG